MDNVSNLTKLLKVELIQVNMSAFGIGNCSSCESVQSKLLAALQAVEKLFEEIGCEVVFKTRTIKTVDEARELNIIASPTIRVGNLDFYPKHLSDKSEDRLWTWQGENFNSPNQKTLIEVILKGYFQQDRKVEDKVISPYVAKYLSKTNTSSSSCESSCGCS